MLPSVTVFPEGSVITTLDAATPAEFPFNCRVKRSPLARAVWLRPNTITRNVVVSIMFVLTLLPAARVPAEAVADTKLVPVGSAKSN